MHNSNRHGKAKNKVFLAITALLIAVAVVSAALGIYAIVHSFIKDKNSPNTDSGESDMTNLSVTAADTQDTGKYSWSFSESDEKLYCLDGSGNTVNEFSGEIDGQTVSVVNGSLYNGWATIGSTRYHVTNGVLDKGKTVIDGVTRYINKDGSMYVGWYSKNSTDTYYYDYETGQNSHGWKEIDGKNYYFDEHGKLDNTVNGETDAVKVNRRSTPDDNTWDTAYNNLSAETKAKLQEILNKYGKSPNQIYNYVHDNFKYKYVAEKSVEENAKYMLNNGTGACYNYAALTYLLFREAGYNTYYVTGKGWQPGDYHCWILAEFDGGWYYVDSLYVRSAKLTKAQLIKLGYEWNSDKYPA